MFGDDCTASASRTAQIPVYRYDLVQSLSLNVGLVCPVLVAATHARGNIPK
jgi:hypothetical protein